MSKRSMLKLFEENGRGRPSRAVALPGQLHSQPGSLATLDDPETALRQDRRSEDLVKLTGGPLPGPLGYPATP